MSALEIFLHKNGILQYAHGKSSPQLMGCECDQNQDDF